MLLPVLMAVLSAAPSHARVVVSSPDSALESTLQNSLRRAGFIVVSGRPLSVDEPVSAAERSKQPIDVSRADILIRAELMPGAGKRNVSFNAVRLPSREILLERISPVADEGTPTLVQATDEYASQLQATLGARTGPAAAISVTVHDVLDSRFVRLLGKSLETAGAKLLSSAVEGSTATFSVEHPRGVEGLTTAQLKVERRQLIVEAATRSSITLRVGK